MSDGPEEMAAVVAAETTTAAEAVVTGASAVAVELPPASIFDQLAARRMAQTGKNMVFGITADMLGDYLNRSAPATEDELAAVTEEVARDILYRRYWMPIAGDKLPPEIASAIFDVAYRRGVDHATKLVQRAIKGVDAVAIKVDGRMDKPTLTALQSIVKNGAAVALAERAMAERTTFRFRLFDGKFLGRDIDLGGAMLIVGKALVKAKTGITL